MDSFKQFIFLHTDACHLCELGIQVVEALARKYPQLHDHISLELRDIVNEPRWLAQYGESIPVLIYPEQETVLKWPFDESALGGFIAEHVQETHYLESK